MLFMDSEMQSRHIMHDGWRLSTRKRLILFHFIIIITTFISSSRLEEHNSIHIAAPVIMENENKTHDL